MINVNELKRNAKNIVKKYSDAQVKVREATSNDPWGPSSTIMAELAELTHNVVAFSEIMQMIWKRLNDHGKNWRHVFKSLVLLEYLIKTGNEKVAQQCIENIFAIQTLKDFQYIEENKDHGSSVREKSKRLVALLKDPERLAAERTRALKARARLLEAVSSSSSSFNRSSSSSINRSSNLSGDLTGHNGSGKSSSGMLDSNSNNYQFAEADSSSGLGSDLDSARPHSLTEEETQLKIALALSKEEAERQEKTRKNDELRLKLALDASKQAAAAAATASSSSSANHLMDDFSGSSSSMTSGPSQQSSSRNQSSSRLNKQSNIDDLLGLSFSPAESSASVSIQQQQQQRQHQPVTSTEADALFGPPLASSSSSSAMPSSFSRPLVAPQYDPWSVDPWQPVTMPAPTSSPASFLNSNVISASQQSRFLAQQMGDSPLASSSLASSSSPLATTLPSTQQPINAPATTLVPNQFPITSLDSIFSSNPAPTSTATSISTAALAAATTTTNQAQARKVLSKNPFED